MTTATLSTHVPAASGRAVGRLAVRQIRRGAVIVSVVCAGISATVAAQYQATFRGSIDAAGLRALAENPAVRILFGPPVTLDDPGGFTVWRTGTPLLVFAGVWALLAATRITRGEEDAGRSDLLLAGRLRTVDLIVRCLVAVTGAASLIGVAVACALTVAGTDVHGAVLHACAVAAVTLTFGTAAVVSAQIMPTRSAAVGVTVGALGGWLLLRMLADGVTHLAWLAWLTPFGLTARIAPYAENRVVPLAVLSGFPVVFIVAALLAARHRDIGSSLVTVATLRTPRTGLLGSIGGFAVRRAIGPTLAWAAGIVAYFLLLGALIASILEFFSANPRFAELAGAAGFAGLNTATGFAAALFGLLAIPGGLYGATRMAALVADERTRRWTTVLSAPVTRQRLICTEIAVTTAGVLLLHVAAGLAMGIGAAVTSAPLRITDAVAGALNTAPIAWLAIGAGTLAAGWFPSAVAAVGALPVAGGFLLDVIAESVHAPTWIAELSPFAHVAAVPGVGPDWTAVTGLAACALVLAVVGVAGYARRDMST